MLDWCLWIASRASIVLEYPRTRRLVDALAANKHWAIDTTNPVRATQLQQERRHLIQRFLDDPGYAPEAFVRALHEGDRDVFPPITYQRYMAGPFRRQQAFLRGESLAHVTLSVSFALLYLLARLGAGVWAPTFIHAALLAWGILLLADIVWSSYLSPIARALVLNLNTNGRELFEELVDITVEGLHWWQLPGALPLAWIVKRIGPSTPAVSDRRATAG